MLNEISQNSLDAFDSRELKWGYTRKMINEKLIVFVKNEFGLNKDDVVWAYCLEQLSRQVGN